MSIKVKAAVAAIIFSVLGYLSHQAYSFDWTGHSLMNNLETAEANTDDLREEFYDLINEARFDKFVDAKVEQETVQRMLNHYIETKEELLVDSKVEQDIRLDAKRQVLRVFIEKVLENNDLNENGFYNELGNLLKLPAIETLHPTVREKASKLLKRLRMNGISAFVFEGHRTPERQDYLYEQGRSRPGKRVTNAKAWESVHQTDYAFDIVCLENGKPTWSNCNYELIGKLGKDLDLVWGGDWDIVDKPHFELPRDQWSQEAIIKQYVCKRKSPVCDNSDDFVKIGKEKGVDPYLLVAIATADTSLGAKLKTPFNIGNVGNYDHGKDGKTCIGRTTGGCTRSFKSWYEGIRAMAEAKSIRVNSMVGQLSPGGKIKTNAHYATSKESWHKNVISVLSKLYDRKIENTFNYKLYN